MEVLVESTPVFSEKTKARSWTLMQVVLGSLFLAACAQITIPLYPIPLTMQTLGIFFLAAVQGGKKASYSALLYLGLITVGLPILAGGLSNSLWFTLPQVGYLFAFPIAAFVIGKLIHSKKNASPLWILGSILVGQAIIYTLGVAGLTRFLSIKESMMVGVVPFIPLAGIKILIASSLGGLWLRWKR